jgi:hypothetical protein
VAPPRMRFVSGRTTAGSCAPPGPRQLTCRTAPLGPGRSAAITVTGVASGAGLFVPQGIAQDGDGREGLATFRVSTRAHEGGFAWNMVERSHSLESRPNLRFVTTNPSSPDIAPADLQVRFTCRGAPALREGSGFRWEVATAGGPFVAFGPDACRFTQAFPRDAELRVRLTTTVPTSAEPFSMISEEPVRVTDLLVVSVGDSYASGQGNPPFDFGTDYFPAPCYRSRASGRLEALGVDYRALVSEIATLAPRRTYITEYPDFLRWSDGSFCGTRTGAGGGHPYPGALAGISRDESIASMTSGSWA